MKIKPNCTASGYIHILKTAATAAMCAALLPHTAAFAASGDVIGNIYSTDIRAYINGVEVEAYNIGGRTVVAVEDVTDAYSYNDDCRALIIDSFAPEVLKYSHPETSDTAGDVIGEIYESDIVVCMYNQIIPAYSLDGKMTVALEDLGGDGEMNGLMGKYEWDETERTIKLEICYDSFFYSSEYYDTLVEKQRAMELVGTELLFVEDKFNPGGFSGTESTLDPNGLNVITTEIDGEQVTVGYVMMFDNCYICTENGLEADESNSIYCLLPDVVKAALGDIAATPKTREEIIEYRLTNNMYTVKDRLDTDDYTFLYAYAPDAHGGSEYLDYITADGAETEFSSEFESPSVWGGVFFDNVEIDEESERVTVEYSGETYIIDLKTGTMSKSE